MVALEVKFAALRDRLYVERLEEAAKEEEMILNGGFSWARLNRADV